MHTEKSSPLGQQASDFVEEHRDKAVNAIHHVAAQVESKAAQGVEAVTDFGSAARKRLNSAAEYMRECDARAMADDVTKYAKAHPIPMLIGAVAIGFLAGRLVRRA